MWSLIGQELLVLRAIRDSFFLCKTRGASISSITEFLQYTGEVLKSYSISTVLLEGKFWGRNIRENSHKYIDRKERNILCFLLGTREVVLDLEKWRHPIESSGWEMWHHSFIVTADCALICDLTWLSTASVLKLY